MNRLRDGASSKGGTLCAAQLAQAPQQGQVCSVFLAKPSPGSQIKLIARTPAARAMSCGASNSGARSANQHRHTRPSHPCCRPIAAAVAQHVGQPNSAPRQEWRVTGDRRSRSLIQWAPAPGQRGPPLNRKVSIEKRAARLRAGGRISSQGPATPLQLPCSAPDLHGRRPGAPAPQIQQESPPWRSIARA